MRHSIETAPKDGHFVILEDDANAVYDVGRWSPEAGEWVGKDDAAIKITPTHWHPFARDAYLLPDDEGADEADRASGFPWRRFAVPIVGVIAAAIILFYFLEQETVQRPAGAVSDGAVTQNTRPPSKDLRAALPEVRPTVEKPASPPRDETQPVRELRAAVTPKPEAQQSANQKVPDIAAQEAAGAQELGKAQRTIERLEAQLRASATSEQMLKQERERVGTLAEQVAAARQELAANTAQHGRAFEEERARSAVLASELASARRDIEALTTQSRKASDEAALLKQADIAKTEQLREQQRQHAAALAEAAAARQALTANTAQPAQAADEERSRNAALENELAAARRHIEALTAQARKAGDEAALLKQAETAKTEQLLEQQRQNVAAVAETAAARQELTAITAQNRQALDTERVRSTALASELAAARRDIETQTAQSRQANNEAGLLKQAETAKIEQLLEQQRQKLAAALAEAATARQELTANTAQHRQALDQERARSAILASELATARRDIETQTAQARQGINEAGVLKQAETAKTEQLLEQQRQKMAAALAETATARQELTANSRALEAERARSAALAGDLATARQENERQAAQFRLAGEETESRQQADREKMAGLQQALKEERDRAVVAAAELDATRRAAAARLLPETAPSSPISRETEPRDATAMAPPAASDVQGVAEATRMIARAGVLLGQGDIGAARIVLERAAELGSARAVFMLAETYDPIILSAWRTYGTRGEVTRARELYAKAHAGGIPEAKERFDSLGR